MSSLNNDLNIDWKTNKRLFSKMQDRYVLLQFYDKQSELNSPYTYPNTDVCAFKHFPHKQLVYPSILLAEQIECTCTLVWLLSYSNDDYFLMEEHYAKRQLGFTLKKFLGLTARYCVNALNESDCDFEKLFAKCPNEQIEMKSVSNLVKFAYLK